MNRNHAMPTYNGGDNYEDIEPDTYHFKIEDALKTMYDPERRFVPDGRITNDNNYNQNNTTKDKAINIKITPKDRVDNKRAYDNIFDLLFLIDDPNTTDKETKNTEIKLKIEKELRKLQSLIIFGDNIKPNHHIDSNCSVSIEELVDRLNKTLIEELRKSAIQNIKDITGLFSDKRSLHVYLAKHIASYCKKIDNKEKTVIKHIDETKKNKKLVETYAIDFEDNREIFNVLTRFKPTQSMIELMTIPNKTFIANDLDKSTKIIDLIRSSDVYTSKLEKDIKSEKLKIINDKILNSTAK